MKTLIHLLSRLLLAGTLSFAADRDTWPMPVESNRIPTTTERRKDR